jgi:Flp pilus assembly protein TadG
VSDVLKERNEMQVRWNTAQLKQLEDAFPELTGTTDANTLLVNAGRREVVLFVKGLLLNQNVPTEATSYIPEEILYGDE